ncbi:MAG: ABC transporter permease [Rhodobiaceae bacterium]|nr:ABC transporter permease [Rhodobiaceae bacterium]
MIGATGRGGPAASAGRIGAMILRYWYLLRSSWPRLLELVYWPTVQMFMWGFLQSYLHQQEGMLALAGGALLGAVLLWDILFRGQIGFSISFLEEMWAQNLGHLMISPLRAGEFIAALMVMSLIRVIIGVVPVSVMAVYFFGFNIYGLGLALVGFFVILMVTSWAIGLLVCGLVLRQGLGAESLVWSLIFLMLPLACVYYPVTTLPHWLQYVALALPPTYVFEGMRAILIDGVFRPDLLMTGLALNLIYLAIGLAAFLALLRSARIHGSLLVSGE